MCLFSERLAKCLASGLVPGPSRGLAWALRGCQYLGLIGQAGAPGATHLSSGRYGLNVFVCFILWAHVLGCYRALVYKYIYFCTKTPPSPARFFPTSSPSPVATSLKRTWGDRPVPHTHIQT